MCVATEWRGFLAVWFEPLEFEQQQHQDQQRQQQRDKEERRASRALRRISSSSARSTASSLFRAGVGASPPVPERDATAGVSYAVNLRAGRTPTIEAVLQKGEERERQKERAARWQQTER